MPRSLLAFLAVLGAGLTLSVVPGVFTIDEDNYLVTVTALRHGRLTVPGTEGLPPARELVWFDPNGANRTVTETPVASTAPPLYAPLALPFSLLGWRGLVALNTLCFLLAIAAVFLLTRRHARHHESAWIAAITFAAGGYALEYAQGLWPHMLTASLCTGAVLASTRTREEPGTVGAPAAWALAAGALVGLAAGVRYQNFLFAACLGLGILLFSSRRWRCSVTYALGVAVPLGASSLLNHARLGFWNPISKGGTYLSSLGGAIRSQGWFGDAFTMGWARIVDYSTRPPLAGTEHAVYLRSEAATGAYLVAGAVKKAWLQSSPWLVLALLALVLAWLPSGGRSGGKPDPKRRELRVLALIVLPILAMFSASGVLRTDGLSFNQRYFIELVPLAAVAFAWLLDDSGLLDPARTDVGDRRRRFGLLSLGAVLGVSLAAAALQRPAPSPIRLYGLLHLPLALAVLALFGWAICRGSRRCGALALAVGACLGWSLAVHVGDDMVASRAIRRQNARLAAVLDPVLTDRSAYMAYWGAKDAAGPLLLDRDLVVLDVRNDDGRNMPSLVAALRARGWRVVALPAGFPPALREALAAESAARALGHPPFPLVELVAREPTESAPGAAPAQP